MLEQDVPPPEVPSLHKQLARSLEEWSSFAPPSPQDHDPLTVLDVAFAESVEEHVDRSQEWANQLWNAWIPYHDRVVELADNHLDWDMHRPEECK